MVESYPDLYETFRWHVPKGFNLASACCFQWSGLPGHEQRPALIFENRAGHTEMVTFSELGRISAQLANGLSRLGVIPGDRVVIVLSNPADSMAALLACWAIRAVAVPLAPGSGADTLLPRIKQARSQVALIDAANQAEALSAIARCPRIKHIVGIDVYDGRVMSWRGLIARQPTTYEPTQTLPSDPAMMVWPMCSSPDLPPQAAMVLAHQSLIGQLPGFVMATNWFPENARQLMTTLKPWDEQGLLAAILPALYFGHTVVLTDRLPTPANLPKHVTHILTTGPTVLDTLKSDVTNLPASTGLAGLALLEHTLEPQWRDRIELAYGITPNLATFVSGCGLLIAQSLTKWPQDCLGSGRLVPGHLVRLEPLGETDKPTNNIGELQASRVDSVKQTDPAQFVQAWPVKDALDLSTELPAWWRTGLSAQLLDDGCWRVLGPPDQWQILATRALTLWQLEQAALLQPEVKWAEVAFVAQRKSQNDDLEIWVMVDTGTTGARDLKSWRDELRSDITNRILESARLDAHDIKIRVGLVDRQALAVADQSVRSPWQTRAFQSLIDFL